MRHPDLLNQYTMEDDKLKNVQQPVITATGISPGVTLSIAANWVRKTFAGSRYLEYLLAISLCIHILISIVVLYRILNLNYPGDRANDYYRKTLFLFIAGISLYFLLIVFSMFDSAIVNR
jgi:hypothetical protein